MTILLTIITNINNQKFYQSELNIYSSEIRAKIQSRLHSHAAILRSGAAFFGASDSVTRKEWENFIKKSKIDKNLPGIQGVGYSAIINKGNIKKHIETVNNEINGLEFPVYSIKPSFKRNFYTSIIYLEPFNKANQRAFGFDMFTDSTRRTAMEKARDLDVASLSGKVILVQESGKNIQNGTLMYVPVYNNKMPVNSIEERRKAVKGWVYSPYRMNDLMNKIIDDDTITFINTRLKIFDDNILENQNLIFDSNIENKSTIYNVESRMSIDFNGKKWGLLFQRQLGDFDSSLINIFNYVFFIGILISILVYLLIVSLIKTRFLNNQLNDSKNEINRILDNLQIVNNDLMISENELKSTIQTKDKFFSIIAHDLKGPISSLNSLASLLVMDFESFDKKELLNILDVFKNQTDSTLNLLLNLLDWARSQRNEIKYNFEKFDLNIQINNIISLLNPIAENKKIKIINLIDFEIFVYADFNTINTVIRNLISNAIKYSYENSVIHINISDKNNGFATFSIRDYGTGMDNLKINSLFKHETNISTIGTNRESGTGLGLILCKEFVVNNGGKIWVESELNSGSCFYFSLKISE